MSDINNYAALFYKDERIVGVSTFDSTRDEARKLINLLANTHGEFLPNDGEYDGVSFIQTDSIDSILDGAIRQIENNKA
jgi:hypothetical protein